MHSYLGITITCDEGDFNAQRELQQIEKHTLCG